MVVLLTIYIHNTIFCIMYTFCLFSCKAFCTLLLLPLGIADSKQEEFQKGSGKIQAVITFVV